MLTIRKANARGQHHESWLDSRHTFSFHTYHDPKHMGFRDLRVINEDRVAPSRGFGMHPHQDMEIFSLVLSGALEHRDNLGNREVIGPWQMQKITAGSGVLHSEYNPSAQEPVHFLQIWILPARPGLQPGYVIKDFSSTQRNQLVPILTPDGRDGSAQLHQDVSVLLGRFDADVTTTHALQPGRHAWLQMLAGAVEINGQLLGAGDGAATSDESRLSLAAAAGSAFLLFDLK